MLGNWGVPVFSDQILGVGIHDFLARRDSQPISVIGDKDIFALIGYCISWAEILDFRRAVSQRPIRYDATIAPFSLRDGTASTLWTHQTLIDTALTGDPWAAPRMVYCAGGIASRQFDLSPSSADVRTLLDCYRLVGQECEADPEGSIHTHSIPHSQGKVAVAPTDWGAQYSRHSHIPLFSVDSIYGVSLSWPSCVCAGLQPSPSEVVAILGGHIGLLGEEITIDQCE